MAAKLEKITVQFGSALRVMRKEAGWSQMTLAERASLTLSYVGEIERGEKMASLETLVKLAVAFRISGAALLERAKI